jgi:hypothetical protein
MRASLPPRLAQESEAPSLLSRLHGWLSPRRQPWVLGRKGFQAPEGRAEHSGFYPNTNPNAVDSDRPSRARNPMQRHTHGSRHGLPFLRPSGPLHVQGPNTCPILENVPLHEPCLRSGGRPACRRGGRLAPRNPRFMAREQVIFEQGALHEPPRRFVDYKQFTAICFAPSSLQIRNGGFSARPKDQAAIGWTA